MHTETKKFEVLVVCPWFFAGDAVGAAARETVLMLRSTPQFRVSAIGTRNDYTDIDVAIVPGLAGLLLHPAFLRADLIIYHFAIYQEMFDALLIGNGRARQVVIFHNVTPKQFMWPEARPLIDRSFVQMQNFRLADEIWAVSQENAEELIRRGIPPNLVRVLPLAVDRPAAGSLSNKPAIGRLRSSCGNAPVQALYVGRFAPSKGIIELVRAVALANRLSSVPIKLRLVGNLNFSHPPYVEAVRTTVVAEGAEDIVEFVGTVHAQKLASLFSNSHLFVSASYHEGFCVPVIEGLRAGCIPVTSDAGNLRYIADGLGRTTPSGDMNMFATALAEVAADVEAALADLDAPALQLGRGAFSARAFDEAVRRYVAGFTGRTITTQTIERAFALAAFRSRAAESALI